MKCDTGGSIITGGETGVLLEKEEESGVTSLKNNLKGEGPAWNGGV
jgi:hypothetical protein